MPFIAKSAPVIAAVGDKIQIEETAMYGGNEIGAGDSIFLWASETQGGRGLWAQGTVVKVGKIGPKLRIEVRVDQRPEGIRFGLDQIAPHRDDLTNAPIGQLSRKLYKHAHNKIAGITIAEANLLQQQFQ